MNEIDITTLTIGGLTASYIVFLIVTVVKQFWTSLEGKMARAVVYASSWLVIILAGIEGEWEFEEVSVIVGIFTGGIALAILTQGQYAFINKMIVGKIVQNISNGGDTAVVAEVEKAVEVSSNHGNEQFDAAVENAVTERLKKVALTIDNEPARVDEAPQHRV